jgi:hypothetical protein
MKKLVFGLLLIGFGLVSIQHFSKMEEGVNDELTVQINKTYEEQVLDNKIRVMVNNVKSLDDLDKIEKEMQSLPATYKERLAPIISLKRATCWFNEAEDYLRKAIEIERAVASVPQDQPMPSATDPENPDNPEQIPPPQRSRELHPLTLINFNKAIALYEKARKECEKLKDSFDTDFDYHTNYLKGEIYYRILELVADQESAPALFNQTLTYYKYALRSRSNDMNTIINIEILIKNQNELVGNAGNPQRKKQMLNSKKYGIGKSSGN